MPPNQIIKSVNVVGRPGGTVYSIQVSDTYINVFSLNGPVTLVLPKTTDNWMNLGNKTYYISDKSGTSFNNNITIICQPDAKINYQASVTMNTNGMFALVTMVNLALWQAKFQYSLGEPASQIAFNNTSTSLSATNVQAALVEIANGGGGGGGSGSDSVIELGLRIGGMEYFNCGNRV